MVGPMVGRERMVKGALISGGYASIRNSILPCAAALLTIRAQIRDLSDGEK
jgi:hypothetical protein